MFLFLFFIVILLLCFCIFQALFNEIEKNKYVLYFVNKWKSKIFKKIINNITYLLCLLFQLQIIPRYGGSKIGVTI